MCGDIISSIYGQSYLQHLTGLKLWILLSMYELRQPKHKSCLHLANILISPLLHDYKQTVHSIN